MDHVETNIDKSRSPLLIPFAILLLVATVGGVATILALLHHGGNGTNGTGDNVPAVSSVGPTTFSKTGPMPVGETTLHLKSGAPIEVWYPASADSYHGHEATYNVLNYLPPRSSRRSRSSRATPSPTPRVASATSRWPMAATPSWCSATASPASTPSRPS